MGSEGVEWHYAKGNLESYARDLDCATCGLYSLSHWKGSILKPAGGWVGPVRCHAYAVHIEVENKSISFCNVLSFDDTHLSLVGKSWTSQWHRSYMEVFQVDEPQTQCDSTNILPPFLSVKSSFATRVNSHSLSEFLF